MPDYVQTPAGLYHRTCVNVIPDGARLRADQKTVTRKDGTSYQLPECLQPGAPGLVDNSGSLVQATHFPAASTDKTTWDEYEYAFSNDGSSNVFWGSVAVGWHVPPKPSAWSNGEVLYYWPGIQTLDGMTLLQPVLGFNVLNSGQWSIAAWKCATSCVSSSRVNVSPGDSLEGDIGVYRLTDTSMTRGGLKKSDR